MSWQTMAVLALVSAVTLRVINGAPQLRALVAPN